jgi:predicted MPP superfamily phosphohydrolase
LQEKLLNMKNVSSALNILHLSDLHWHSEARADFRIIRDALISDLTDLNKSKSRRSIDLVLFSGDLVRGGEDFSEFNSAYVEFLKPVLDALNLSAHDLVICPRNHDISRKVVRASDIIENGLMSSLSSVGKINKFIDDLDTTGSVRKLAFERMENYGAFLKEIDYQSEQYTDLFHIKSFDVRGYQIKVASINNSWRSSGERGGVDRGRLVMGERVIDQCVDLTSEADFRIAMFHHPVDWMLEADASCVSPRIFSGFELIAFGHVHAMQPELRISPSGTSILSQSGALFAGRDYFNGYQILSVDLATCEANIELRTYYDAPARRFGPAENINPGGLLSLTFKSRSVGAKPELEAFLREVRGVIRENALNQFNVSDLGGGIGMDPHTAFICPPIFIRTSDSVEPDEEDSEAMDSPSSSNEVEFLLDDILREEGNFLFIGAREGGKTSLANFVAVQVSDGISDRRRIPVLVDYRDFTANKYGIQKSISSYLKITKAGLDVEKSLVDGDILFLIDNFSGKDLKKRGELHDLIREYPDCRWIAFADERYGGTNPELAENDLIEGATVARLDRLPRKAIREMTRRWCSKTGADDEVTYSAVMKQIKEGDLPRNGYIVTLLLWAIAQNKKFDSINESVLIMNMADFLLGKADFTKSLKGEFDATSKEITLQRIAGFFASQDGVVTLNKLTSDLIKFFDEMGLNYEVSEVISSLCECGILRKSDGTISFKYRCFEEYFEARRIGSSVETFKAAIFNRAYLKNTRQLELLSGISRQNETLIQELLLEIEMYSPPDIQSIDVGEFESLVVEASNVGMTARKLKRIQNKKLTSEQVDDLVDAAEAKLNGKAKDGDKQSPAADTKESHQSDAAESVAKAEKNMPLRPIEFLATLDLLGNVLTNSEFTRRDLKVQGGIALLDGSTRVFLRLNALIQEALDDAIGAFSKSDPDLDEKSIKGLRYMMTRKILVNISGRVSNTFSSPKLSAIYDEILDSSDIAMGDRVLLTATLLDSGYKNWNERWVEVARAKPTRRLLIEFLADKLWDFMHQKAMDSKLQNRVEKVAVDLQVILAGSSAQKSIITRDVKRHADKAAKSDSDLS